MMSYFGIITLIITTNQLIVVSYKLVTYNKYQVSSCPTKYNKNGFGLAFNKISQVLNLAENSLVTPESDSIFGAEFQDSKYKDLKSYDINSKQTDPFVYQEIKTKAMDDFNKLRSTFLSDSILVSLLGFSLVWYFGTYKDSLSFGLGAFLGITYSILLGKYIERIGTAKKSKLSDSFRFGPVILSIALYGKFKTEISIIPELLGYFTSYQLGSFLQIFNQSLYDAEDDLDKEEK